MSLFGLYVRDLDAGDLVWFITERSLSPGDYVLGRRQAGSPNVYVAESIPALILAVGPVIQRVELRAQAALSTPDMSPTTRQRIASEVTDNLLQQLTETSSIWIAEPHWVRDLVEVSNGRP